MKNITLVKKLMCATLVMALAFGVVACGTAFADTTVGEAGSAGSEATEEIIEANTIGTKHVVAFKASTKTTANDIVDELMANVETPYELAKMDVEPGYLNGFDEEIKGFEEGVVFAPMIGSIPFVGYVLKSSDPQGLETELKASANLRWNICTEADEMVSAINGDYVFFMMCTNEE